MSGLILASASAIRAELLRQAGVAFTVCPANVDEPSLKASLLAGGRSPQEIATALAEMKATRVSADTPESLVLGCDQLLEFGGEIIDKVTRPEAARNLLLSLKGRTHTLVTAAILARRGTIVWRFQDCSRIRMREFSDAFLEDYLCREGDSVLSSVGCYKLEGGGAQLFEAIEGDYFSVLGLPLIPLLAALRDHGVLAR